MEKHLGQSGGGRRGKHGHGSLLCLEYFGQALGCREYLQVSGSWPGDDQSAGRLPPGVQEPGGGGG